MRPIFLRPEHCLKEFDVLRCAAAVNDIGRVVYDGGFSKIGSLKGTISNVGQKEIIRFKQLERPVTHTIVVRGACVAKQGDILVFGNNKYYVKTIERPLEMDIFTVIYCEMKEGAGQYGNIKED